MTALEDLRAGRIGEHFVAIVQRTIWAVAIARGFPPPEGHTSWDRRAVSTCVSDFLASPQTPRRLTDLATHCRTEDALRRRLQQTVRNYLADQGRRTPTGRMILRLNDVLSRAPDFERRDSFWALVGMDLETAAVDLDALVAALGAVDLVVPTAWSSGSRQSPELDAASVVRLARAALEAAGGPLRPSTIAQAAARRLGVGGAPMSIDASFFDPPEPAPISQDATSDQVLIKLRAQEVFGHLNDHERIALGLADLPVAKLGPILGVSGSKAALIRRRAVAVLKNDLSDEEGGQLVADAVLDLARTWTKSWMT